MASLLVAVVLAVLAITVSILDPGSDDDETGLQVTSDGAPDPTSPNPTGSDSPSTGPPATTDDSSSADPLPPDMRAELSSGWQQTPATYNDELPAFVESAAGADGAILIATQSRDVRGLWTSTDGTSWHSVPAPTYDDSVRQYGVGLHHARGHWYVNTNETMWRAASLDGAWTTVWRAADLGLSAVVVTDMIEHDGRVIAVGRKSTGPLTGQTPGPPLGPPVSYMDAAAWWSEDGENWELVHVPLVPPGTAVSQSAPVRSTMNGVAAHGGQLVAVGEQHDVGTALVWRSTDGSRWELSPGFPIGSRECPHRCASETGRGFGPGSAGDVQWFDGDWYVVGSTRPHPNSSAIWTSPDGVDWSEVTLPQELQQEDLYQELTTLLTSPHGLVAGRAGLGPQEWGLLVSPDGRRWEVAQGVNPQTIVAHADGFIGWNADWSWTAPP